MKAIIFYSVFFLSILFLGCDDKSKSETTQAVVTLSAAENISTTTATMVAMVTPNQDNTSVAFMYQSNGSSWKTTVVATKLSGTEAVKVTLDLYDLQPSTLYNFKVSVVNAAGTVTSTTSSFLTWSVPVLKPAVIKINDAKNVKISTASLSASVIPNQDNTVVSFEYQTINSAWKNQTLSSGFSGTDSIKVNFDLSDLQPNTLYNFRIKAVNKAGETLSEIASFTTYAVNDYDGNFYHSVTIGSQTWLKENFRGTHYSNGDPIANITDPSTWANLNTGAYCWYNNDPENGKVYGGLYNWYVGADSRGLIVGWHTPTIYEQADLGNYLGGGIAGLAVTETGSAHWKNFKYTATNSSGFTALPNGGFGLYPATQKFIFFALHNSATFWSSSEAGSYGVSTVIDNNNCVFGVGAVFSKQFSFGIRLLKN